MDLRLLCEEYAALRMRSPAITGWVVGALSLLVVGVGTSPGRQLVKRDPVPRMSRLMVAPRPQHVNEAVFVSLSSYQKFAFLLQVAIPSFKSKEMGIVGLLTLLMLLRTSVSVLISKMTGYVGRVVIGGTIPSLLVAVAGFFAACVPAALLNTSLDHYSQRLELYFRDNMTRYFHRRYLASKTFFRLAGLHEVDNIDQRITQDVQRWSRVSSVLVTSITRPLSESVTFTYTLGLQTGWIGPALTWSYYLAYLGILMRYAPNMDWLADKRMEKEGAFRAAHQDLLFYAEEIYVSRGKAFQEHLLQRLTTEMTNQSRYSSYVNGRFNLVERFYTKYGSILMSYIVSALSLTPLLKKNGGGAAEDFSSKLAESSYDYRVLSKAIARLIWNVKLLLIINGYTQRLFQLVESIDMAEYEVQRQYNLTNRTPFASLGDLSRFDDMELEEPHSPNSTFGRVIRGSHIEFDDVPLTLPNGEVLCRSLSFYVKPGMNLLIMGPNGCGKSSTFRLLGELWPLRGGRLVKPEQDQMYYVPQRPYMYDGTLFEQVIYPLKRKDVSVGEAELYGYLEMAGLGYILSRPKVSWDARLSWSGDFLSMGEKQRLAMARLFFHRPRFAILDECSSSVDLDVEEHLYNQCRELGISVITIAHRRSVWRYHSHLLHFDGNGGYAFSALRFEDGGATLVLPHVISASNASLVGTEVVIRVSRRWEDELESAKVAEDAAIAH